MNARRDVVRDRPHAAVAKRHREAARVRAAEDCGGRRVLGVLPRGFASEAIVAAAGRGFAQRGKRKVSLAVPIRADSDWCCSKSIKASFNNLRGLRNRLPTVCTGMELPSTVASYCRSQVVSLSSNRRQQRACCQR